MVLKFRTALLLIREVQTLLIQNIQELISTLLKPPGNVEAGIKYGQLQKQNIEENTGINNIVAGAGSENTLGSTVIMKEAAYNRLTPPKKFNGYGS